MGHSASLTQWLFSRQEEARARQRPVSPIRTADTSEDALRELAQAMASGERLELPHYEPFSFRERLAQNAKLILHAFRAADAAARNHHTITPATQWLIDNYYTIDKAIQQTRRDFPKDFLRQLPPYPAPSAASRPSFHPVARIFALAWLYVAHTDSSFSLRTLTAMVKTYQKTAPFQIGELWALPSAVRFILIENARRIATALERSSYMRHLANRAADRLVRTRDRKEQEDILSSYEDLVADTTFSSHLLYRLRSTPVNSTPALTWLENRLVEQGSSTEDIIAAEHDQQTADSVTISNIIRALKTIDDADWPSWFENVSHVDFLLKDNSDFAEIDAHSRNAYRVVIEKIAQRSPLSELEITRKAISLTASGRKKNPYGKTIAYYLVGEGRPALETSCRYRPRLSERFMRRYRAMKIWSIALPVSLLTVAVIAAVYALVRHAGVAQSTALLFAALSLFPAIDMAFSFFNTLISWLVAPRQLIGFEYKNGIPEEARTLIAVPTIITSQESITEQIRNLEVHYLSNPRGAVSFALVTDWKDAATTETVEDRKLLDCARKGIAALNRHYSADGQPLFFLLHRRRLYNKGEGCWMGWERKRGKLHELNRLLRARHDTSFLPHDPRLPSNIRFVMTLDSDTLLTPGAVTRMAGKLSHPLNRPGHDPETGSVVRGHAILQPRVTHSLTTGDEASFLQRVFSVNRGIDPYVFAVSDTYQDLLDEGTFTGKGLYDIDAFETALKGRIDENAVLSHDMLEGGYARAALVSDVEVIEDYPTTYHVDAARHHRWVRGDWQLLPYLFKRRHISATTRWKLLDNLRRTLTPLAWLAASIAGWCLLPLAIAAVWQVFLLVGMHIAPTLGILRTISAINRDYLLRGHCQSVLTGMATATADIALRTTFLAHTAWYMSDAVIRTLYRMGVSHRHLLEWRTSAAAKSAPGTLLSYLRLMWPAPLIAILALALPLWLKSNATLLAVPFAMLWFFSPFIAWLASRSAAKQDALELRLSDTGKLRRIARRTWHFYETFVTADNNHLPPDNFQEDPEPVLARRTSPTNIGVYLLSVVAARDFGWISLEEAVERIAGTLHTLGLMEKHRGHLYNWYETDTLRPLAPLYVSTVDSGNLAGHLVTLCSALKEWAHDPVNALQGDVTGLFDTAGILEESLDDVAGCKPALLARQKRLREQIAAFRQAVDAALKAPVQMPAHEHATAVAHIPSLAQTACAIGRLADELDAKSKTAASRFAAQWAHHLMAACQAHIDDAGGEHKSRQALSRQLVRLGEQARQYAFDMMFDFLERRERRLLSIGYRVQENELDESCYDLLASEARLSSLFAIAKGDIKVEHWFQLGRMLVPVGWKGALLSWSGSMFEYLMPPLVMREPLGSLLDQTSRLVVRRQIAYGRQRRLPWGISEAAFNARDPLMNYQYSNFGVPSLGLQRGLSRNMVIAPYASLLAAQYQPGEAVANLTRLQRLGALGRYGYYDAVDFTPSRVPEGDAYAIVRNYYAHHHGMSILAVNNVVFDGRMRKRFHRDPVIEAAELLLQEKAPREIPVMNAKAANPLRSDADSPEEAPMRIIETPLASPHAARLMAGGGYHVMLTAKGSGYSRWNGFAVTRYQPDAAEDQQGTFLFVRDVASGRWWSATGEPTRVAEEETKTVFTAEKAEFYKSVDGLKSRVECIMAHQGEGEGRRIELVNTTGKDRVLEITSYAELALATDDAEAAHPAFSRLFVETEIADKGATIFARRRKRGPQDADIHAVHFVTDPAGVIENTRAETDRRVFIGRGRSIRRPAAFDRKTTFDSKMDLDGSAGCVMDPVAAIRCRVRIAARKKIALVFWTMAASSRKTLKANIAWHRRANAFTREFSAAWTDARVTSYQIGLSPQEVTDYQKYAGYLIYPERLWLPPQMIARNLGSQSDLWPMSISGDYPLFVLRFDNENDIPVLQGLLRAHEYWRRCGLVADIVILNERASSYAQDTQRAIDWLCESYRSRSKDAAGKVHIFTPRLDMISRKSLDTLLAAARIVLHAGNGSLSEQLKRMEAIDFEREAKKTEARNTDKTAAPGAHKQAEKLKGKQAKRQATAIGLIAPPDSAAGERASGNGLSYWNGYGGFDQDGSYVIRLAGTVCTPHPWINVISNSSFGMHVSAEGAPFSWTGNSRDYQLTPWSNDPVSNRPGEALYIVDRDSGERFSPVAAVERNSAVLYEARHGMGFSSFSSVHGHIASELTYTVDPEKPLRLCRLVLHNKGSKRRRLRLYHYVEWILGSSRAKTAPFLVPYYDRKHSALLATNPYHTGKPAAVSFVCANALPSSVTSSRLEFIGADGTVKHPAAIRQAEALSNTVEAGGDPCAALAYDVELAAAEAKEIVFYLGSADNRKQAGQLLDYARASHFDTVLQAQQHLWKNFCSRLQVKTPDPAFDLMVNQWLPYQAYACRILARAAFYQASGAYGFRDQLQDTLALLLLKPELARNHLITVAAHQFIQGDVQHWWLPTSGTGVRTMISDDVVWLGYGAALYVNTTGDDSLLDEQIPFLEGEELKTGQHDSYFQPAVADKTASLYEHCTLALELAIKRTGKNGLPLMLGGDWNDSMNLVGNHGRGESVWLGWFLGLVLKTFIPIAEKRGDRKHAASWARHLGQLTQALEKSGWDGAWYRRGYYDDGAPLGSDKNEECRIDTIAQSWSVLSGLAPLKRQEQAMQSMIKHLFDKEAHLLRLFWPPFNNTEQEPGYIKGYPPGVRENGGQYTHGALWSIVAFAKLADAETAYRLFTMANPIHHGASPQTYRVEPYVIAADIYSAGPHRGRGGWTWYTGAAGWYYRAATEAILGIRWQADRLFLDPVLPSAWQGYSARWQFEKAVYHIRVEYGDSGKTVCLDGKTLVDPADGIPLQGNGKHEILVILPLKRIKG